MHGDPVTESDRAAPARSECKNDLWRGSGFYIWGIGSGASRSAHKNRYRAYWVDDRWDRRKWAKLERVRYRRAFAWAARKYLQSWRDVQLDRAPAPGHWPVDNAKPVFSEGLSKLPGTPARLAAGCRCLDLAVPGKDDCAPARGSCRQQRGCVL